MDREPGFKDYIETEGENKGRVKDISTAHELAIEEDKDRETGLSPEEANRKTEGRLTDKIYDDIASKELEKKYKEKLKQLRQEYRSGKRTAYEDEDMTEEEYIRSLLFWSDDFGEGEQNFGKDTAAQLASKIGGEEAKKYQGFQKKLDSEKLDELRKKIREQ
jgi:hypothetical protein